MRVLVTGATGLVGRAVVQRLREAGHAVTAHARSGPRARELLGTVELLVAEPGSSAFREAVAQTDAVVNLAGEPLFGPRWTEARRRALHDSRVGLTGAIADALAGATSERVLVSTSAVGYYGDRGDELLDEASAPGDDFLARLCRDWEQAALRASARVVRLRLGVVLARAGGALEKMLPAFRLGLGGPLGSGRQYFPWIHLEDVVEVIAQALEDPRYTGAFNLVAPTPVTNREFARALGRALGRPAIVRVPALALRMTLGEAAATVLASQRVEPRHLLALGHRFRHPELAEALASIVAG